MTDERIIAYLLEELPEDDLERFEDECFAEESWPDQLHLVEEDLIDAYLRNELTAERRHRFEQNYLTTYARQERVSIAAALLRHVDKYTAQPTPVVPTPEPNWIERFGAFWRSLTLTGQTVTALALLAVISGTLWIAFFRAPTSPTIATLTLTISNINRAQGAQPAQVKLPPQAEALHISLMLPQPSAAAARYRAELENDQAERKVVEVRQQDAQSVLVVIPTAQLKREPYALKLFAQKTDGTEQRVPGSYFFLIE